MVNEIENSRVVEPILTSVVKASKSNVATEYSYARKELVACS